MGSDGLPTAVTSEALVKGTSRLLPVMVVSLQLSSETGTVNVMYGVGT